MKEDPIFKQIYCQTQKIREEWENVTKSEWQRDYEWAYCRFYSETVKLVNLLLNKLSNPTNKLKLYMAVRERDASDISKDAVSVSFSNFKVFFWVEKVKK